MGNIDTGKIRENLKLIENFFLDVLFPKSCIGCGKEGRYICEKCSTFLGEAPLICPVCGKGSFSGRKHIYCPSRNKLDGLISVWEYEGLAKAIIHNIKYRKLGDAVLEFTKLSFETMAKDKERFASFFSYLYSQKPLITFVPMFFRKKKKRRFNQSELIAEEVSKITGIEWISLLKKTKENKSQTELNKEERTNNVKGVFSLVKIFGSSTSEYSEEKVPINLILIDDIWTTGATMKECCAILKKSGVKRVWGFTLARKI